METTSLHHSLALKPPLSTIKPHKFERVSRNQIFFSPLRHRQAIRIRPINGTGTGSDSSNTGSDSTPPQVPPPITPPETVEIRYRRRSRRRSKQESEDAVMTNGRPRKAELESTSDMPKKWEEMSVAEKAIEVYMGDKGLLFWLNKFAYASIFIVIGGWILFRFVGPSLNLYQLETPPLSPTSIFKG